MSATSTTNPVAPIERKDIRSSNLEFKQAKEHRLKWSNGVRPAPGVRVSHYEELSGINEGQKIKVRPAKLLSQTYSEPKSHANKTPKPYGNYDRSRIVHKVDAIIESKDETTALSKSLLELLPQHTNNTNSAIQISIQESAAAVDGDILYSFDNKGPSPGDRGRKVDLGGLIDLAEKKYLSKQTDKLVQGEYEVLDSAGETTVLSKNKGRKSPNQHATTSATLPNPLLTTEKSTLDNDGYELV